MLLTKMFTVSKVYVSVMTYKKILILSLIKATMKSFYAGFSLESTFC